MSNIEPTDENTPEHIAGLREAAKAGKAEKERADQLARENMFLRAGVNLAHKVGQMLFETWKGDDVEALKAEASELGLIDQPQSRQTIDPAEATQQQFRSQLSGPPAAPAGTDTPDPKVAALAQFHEDRKNGVPLENAQYAAFDRIFSAAAEGDKRAIFDPAEWSANAGQYSAGRPRG